MRLGREASAQCRVAMRGAAADARQQLRGGRQRTSERTW
jgi:hypothetical protein